MALLFGAANSNRVTIPNSASIATVSAFTIHGWWYSTTQGDPQRLWSKGDPGRRCNWRASDTNELVFVVARATTGAASTTSGMNYPTNTWLYLAFTFDTTDGCKIFNGTLTQPTTAATLDGDWPALGSGALVDDSSNDLYIGNQSGSIFNDVSAFIGRIAHFRYVARRMDLAEIESYRLSFRPNPDSVVDMHLGIHGAGGVGTQLDWSGKGNHGTITGATLAAHPNIPIFKYSIWMPYVVVTTHAYTATLAGASTPTGAIVKQTSKSLAGSSTPTGAFSRVLALVRTLAGSVTPTGTIIKQTGKTLAGASTPTGTIVNQTGKPLAGATTPTGTVVKATGKAFAGASTPTGAFSRLLTIIRTFTGGITPSGVLTNLKAIFITLTGEITPTGAYSRVLNLVRTLTGEITPTGALAKTLTLIRSFAGSITPGGTVSKALGRIWAGILSFVGTLVNTTPSIQPTPSWRTYIVEFDNRTYSISAEDRTYTVEEQ